MTDKELIKHFSGIETEIQKLRKTINNKNREYDKPYNPQRFQRFFACAITIVLIVLFSLFVIHKAINILEAKESKNIAPIPATSEIKKAKSKTENSADERITQIQNEAISSATIPNTAAEITYRILIISYFVIMALVILLVIYLMINDNQGIQYDKLNELHTLRNILLLNEKCLSENEISEEIKFIDAWKNDLIKDKKMTVPTTSQIIPCEKVIKYKNVKAEFLKIYINAITEI